MDWWMVGWLAGWLVAWMDDLWGIYLSCKYSSSILLYSPLTSIDYVSIHEYSIMN
jgi:hypothetical protein